VTDDVHHFGLVGLLATLVDDRQVDAQALGHGAGTDDTADIGRDDHQVVEALVFDVIDQDRGTVDVVHWNVEETLDLVSVQVDGQHAVDTDHGEHVGNHFGADRHASGARTAVLAGVTEVGDNRGDAGSRGTTEGIGHHDQFHQVVVGWCTGRLNQEDVLAADIFVDFDHDFAVGKLTDRSIAEGNVQLTYDPSRQVGVCVPREDHHLGHAQYLPAEGIPGWVWKMAGAAGFEPTHARIKTW